MPTSASEQAHGRRRSKCPVCGKGRLLQEDERSALPAQLPLDPVAPRRIYHAGTFICPKHKPLRLVRAVGDLGLWVLLGPLELHNGHIRPAAPRGLVYVIDRGLTVLFTSTWSPKALSYEQALELASTWAIRGAQKARKTKRLLLHDVKQLASAWLQICCAQGVGAAAAADTRTKAFRQVRDLFLPTTAWFQSLPEDQLRAGLRRIAAWAAKLPSLPYQPPLLLPLTPADSGGQDRAVACR